ncbi:MAG: N-acetyl-gamma-glutamyl-phosphate reductase, partial [Myxococcota bacterium]
MSKRFKAAIIGATGYGGGEMIRRLLRHPDVELARVVSIDYVGEPVGAAHPNLLGFTDLRFQDLAPHEAARDMDVVLLGLPSQVSAEKVPEILKTGAKIVDLSGAYRLNDVATYEEFYGGPHPSPELIERFAYGLPELFRAQIQANGLVANPGCFATCVELGLLPLAKRGWLTGSVETVAITGSSGSGVRAQPGTHHPVRAVNLKTYKTLVHQHAPEINDTLIAAGGRDVQLQMVPVSAPLSRGLF